MAKKKVRGNGEGSVYQRKDGRWVVEIFHEDNTRKQYYVKSKKEGLEKLRQAISEREQGTLANGPHLTLKQYLEIWLEEVSKPAIRLSSYVKYRKLINGYIIPALGHVQLQKLTPRQVQHLYNQKLSDGLAPKTINSIHGVLHRALDNAVKWNYVSRNICDLVSPPRMVRSEIRPLTLEQAHKLLEVVRGDRLEVLLTLALTTGMRRGELLALRWSDIDFKSGSLNVHRTVDFLAKYGYIETEPKTAAGRRKITLPQFVIEMLLLHREQQLEVKVKLGDTWEERNLVFTGLQGGYLNPRYLIKLLNKLVSNAGLPHMRFHDLRHSAATLLLSMGVNPKVIQEILGHSHISMTLGTYSHVLLSMQKDCNE